MYISTKMQLCICGLGGLDFGGDVTWTFKRQQVEKFTSYEEMINMKNVQNHVNYSKITILEELLVITHPKTGCRIKPTRTDFQKTSSVRICVVNKTYRHLWVLCFCGFKSSKFQLFLEQKISFFGQELTCLAQVKVKLLTWTVLRGVL